MVEKLRSPLNCSLDCEGQESGALGITIETADLERDAEAVARIFSQPSVIPHLSGVTPQMLDETTYKTIREQYNIPILAATREGVRGYYRRNRGERLLVARDDKSGNVIGTVTLQSQGLGVTAFMIGRLAVDENNRRRHIGRDLVIRACDMALANETITQIDASVILGIEGDEAAQRLFRNLGFISSAELQGRALSWDSDRSDFAVKSVLRMGVYRANYLANKPQTSS